MQKQPGMRDERLTIEVSIPPGARLTSIPDGGRVTDDGVTVTTTLTRDHQLEIRYQLP